MTGKPKHLVLSDWIRERIKKGDFPNGSKLMSENELAAKFSISRQTARQGISTMVNEGLLERRQGSGTYVTYEPSGSREKTNNIAVITTYLDHYIFPAVIQGIDRVLSKNNYNMKLGITYNKSKNERRVLTSMLESGVDAFIIEPAKSAFPSPNIELYHKIKNEGIPVLFINGYYSALKIPYVALDDYEGGGMVTRYLLENGHDQVFGIFKSDDIQGHLRFSGFLNALRGSTGEYDDNNVLWYVTEDLEELFSPKNDKRLLERFGDASGIVCYNDEIAYQVCQLLNRVGKKVPKDYSVISFDNSNLAVIGDMSLTTVDYPAEMIGNTAAVQMVDALKNRIQLRTNLIKPALVERNSVKKFKK